MYKPLSPCFILFALLLGTVSARGGPIPQHSSPTSPHPLVSVTAATSDNLPQLDASLVQKFHPYAFILTNQSEKAIIALMTHWTFTDAQGAPRDGQINMDSFLQPHSPPVLRPHERLIVAPGAFLPERLATAPHVGAKLEDMDGRRSPAFMGASNFHVTIDLVVFEDGEMAGPNETQYDVKIQNRKIAATQLAEQVRNAIASGYDPKAILDGILKSAPAYSDSVGLWTQTYAQMLSKSRNLDKTLEHLEKLPEPPKFYKK